MLPSSILNVFTFFFVKMDGKKEQIIGIFIADYNRLACRTIPPN